MHLILLKYNIKKKKDNGKTKNIIHINMTKNLFKKYKYQLKPI